MDSFTHDLIVHLHLGASIVLGGRFPNRTDQDIAADWAQRIRSDIALWGPVLQDSQGVLQPGNMAIIPARSVMVVEVAPHIDAPPDPDPPAPDQVEADPADD